MLNKLGKFFPGSDKASDDTKQSQPETQPIAMHVEPEQPAAPQNSTEGGELSLLQLCDQKLNRWTKMLTGEDESPATASEAQGAASPSAIEDAPVIAPAPQSAAKTDNISLLQACDQKLSRWTKFFTGEQDSPAMTPEILVAKAAAEAHTESVAPAEPPHEPEAAADVSLSKTDDKHADKWNSFFSGKKNSVPEAAAEFAEAVTESAAVQPAEKSLNLQAPIITQEPKWGLKVIGKQAEAPEITLRPPVPEPQMPTASAPVVEAVSLQECKIEEQLQMLEHLLERNIMLERQVNKINNSETGLSAMFKEELQRQLSAAAYSYEQQLFANKQVFENMLQSAFDNLVARQDTLGNSYQRQMDLLRQSLEMHRADFVQLHEKLGGLAEQTRQLADKVLQLSSDIAEQQTRSIDIGALAERVSILEQPQKRRSWFDK